MSMPRRQYVVARKRGRITRYFWASQLRDAVLLAKLRVGEHFDYGVMERGNMIECEVTQAGTSGLRYRERGQ